MMCMSTKATKSAATQLFPQFIKDLNRLQPEYSYADRIWQLPLRTGDKPKDWTILSAKHYRDVYYLSWTQSDFVLELNSQGRERDGNRVIKDAGKLAYALRYFSLQVRQIEKDWVRLEHHAYGRNDPNRIGVD